MPHPLHEAVGDVLRSIQGPNIEIWLDGACGGKGRHIRLFGYEPVGKHSCLAYVDAAIVVDDQIKIVVEIEETNVRPLYLCGKVFATAICHYSSRNRTRTDLADSMLFIQVIKEPEPENDAKETTKVRQCRYLEKTINDILKKIENRVHLYSFHHGFAESFASGSRGETELRKEILDFITRPAQPQPAN